MTIAAAVLTKAGFALRRSHPRDDLYSSNFDNARGLRAWLDSDSVLAWSAIPSSPTETSRELSS